MKKSQEITIKVNDTDVQLDQRNIQFYLTETRKSKVNKKGIEKFFTKLWTIFNS